MTTLLGLPSPAQIARQTPAGRDRAIDVLRLGSLVVVVTGHGVMLLVVIDSAGLRMDNLLGYSRALQLVTWLLQVLPLFFFAGAAASARSCGRGTSWGPWLFGRAQRLYRPVFYYLAFWLIIGFPVLKLALPPVIADPVLGVSVQLLWFLGVYILVLAFTPLLARVRTRTQLWLVVGGLYVVSALIDGARLSGLAGFGELVGLTNFVWVWLIPAALGVGYWRSLISRRLAAFGVVVFLAVDLALVTWGPYELSLVTTPGQRLSNMTPPSLLLAGHCLVLCLLAVVVAPWLNRWAQRARVWWVVAIGNSGAMTLYLWHLPALMLVFALSHALGHDRTEPGQAGFLVLLLVQMIVFYLLTAVLFLTFLPLENRPLPWWDRPAKPLPEATGARSVVIGAAVTGAGVATLLLARYGLATPGLVIIGVMLPLLAIARVLVVRR